MKTILKNIKRLLFGLTVIGATISVSNSQIILNNSHFYNVGYKGKVKIDGSSIIPYGPSSYGPNFTLDFSNLVNEGQSDFEVFDAVNAPQCHMSQFANRVIKYYDPLSIYSEEWYYYDLSTNNLDNLDTSSISDVIDLIRHAESPFPISYGDVKNEARTHTNYFVNSQGDSTKQVWYDTTRFEYIGYGTVITPDGTFSNVAQIVNNVFQHSIDYKKQGENWVFFSQSWSLTDAELNYYTNDGSFLVLSHGETSNGDMTNFEWFTQNSVGISQLDESLFFDVYPNPVNNQLTIKFAPELNSDIIYNIYSYMGKIVKTAKVSSQISTINVANLTKGVYMIEVLANNKKSIQKFVKQ